MQDYSVGSTIRNIQAQKQIPVNPLKTGLFFAKGTLNANKTLSIGTAGYYSPYIPFMLPSFPDGLSALSYLKSYGFNYVLGKTATVGGSIQSSKTNPVTGLIYATTTLSDISNLVYFSGQNPTGTVIIGTATSPTFTGQLVGSYIDIDNNLILILNSTSGTISNASCTINVNLSIPFPDPNKSDSACCIAFWFYQQATQSFNYATSPNLYLSIYTGADIIPDSSTFTISATANPTQLSDGSYNLKVDVSSTGSNNTALLPSQAFGNSTISFTITPPTTVKSDGKSDIKADPVTYTYKYNGYTVFNNKTMIINIIPTNNAPAPQSSLTTYTVTLDNTISGYNFVDNLSLAAFGIDTRTYNGTGLKSSTFYTGLTNQRTIAASKKRKYNVQGYVGYSAYDGASVVIANNLLVSGVDDSSIVYPVKIDAPTLNQPMMSSGSVAAPFMYNDLNVEYPIYGTSGAIAGQLCLIGTDNVSNKPSIETLNALANQGCNVVAVNPGDTGTYIFRNLNSLLTLNGLPNKFFNNQDVQLKIRYIDIILINICNTSGYDSVTGKLLNNNDFLRSSIQTKSLGALSEMYNGGNGIIANDYTVNITPNPADTTRDILTVSATIIPAYSGTDIVLTAYQFTYSL